MPRKTAAERQAETRAALVEAGTEAFLDRGYHAASLDAISDRAGFTSGAIYANFRGKEGLFLACVERLSEGQLREWEDFIAQANEFGAQPDSFGKILLTVLPGERWNKALVEFQATTIAESTRQALLASQRRWRDVVCRVLEVYCRVNDLTPAVDLDTIAVSVAAMVDGLRLHSLADPDIDIPRHFMTVLNLVLTGKPARGTD